jgi:hypothetical protein
MAIQKSLNFGYEPYADTIPLGRRALVYSHGVSCALNPETGCGSQEACSSAGKLKLTFSYELIAKFTHSSSLRALLSSSLRLN